MRVSFRLSPLALLLAILSGCGKGDPDEPVDAVSRLILFSIDTLRPDFLSPYNPTVRTTPNFQALASSGIVFTDVIAQAASTARSHKSILYSLYPRIHKTGAHSVPSEQIESPAERIRRAGFLTTALVDGGQLHPRYGLGKGFTTYSIAREKRKVQDLEVLQRLTLQWLDQHADKPFFLFLHTYQMHAPYEPPDRYWQEFAGWYRGTLDPRGKLEDDYNKTSWSDEDQRFIRDLYAAEVAYVDAFLGKILRRLERLDIEESTMVIVLSDHGESLGEKGRFGHNLLSEVEIRIPLIMRIPTIQSTIVSQPVEAIDVMPTIFQVLGIEPPFVFQGRSLLGLVRGRNVDWDKQYRIAEERNRVAVLKGTWKLVFRFRGKPRHRLYNLATDPGEVKNLSKAFPRKVNELKRHWATTMARARDLESRFVLVDGSDPTRAEDVREQLRALGYLE